MIRPLAAQFPWQYTGLTQRQIAEALNLKSGAAVSHQIKRLGEAIDEDASLRRKQAKISREMGELLS